MSGDDKILVMPRFGKHSCLNGNCELCYEDDTYIRKIGAQIVDGRKFHDNCKGFQCKICDIENVMAHYFINRDDGNELKGRELWNLIIKVNDAWNKVEIHKHAKRLHERKNHPSLMELEDETLIEHTLKENCQECQDNDRDLEKLETEATDLLNSLRGPN